jgi:hypothetical protein
MHWLWPSFDLSNKMLMQVGANFISSVHLFQIIMLPLNSFFFNFYCSSCILEFRLFVSYKIKCIYSFSRCKWMFCWQKIINSCRSVFISCSQACKCSKMCCNRPFRREKRVEIVKVGISVVLLLFFLFHFKWSCVCSLRKTKSNWRFLTCIT